MSDLSQERMQKGFEQFRQMVGEMRAEEIRLQWHRISPEFEKFVLAQLSQLGFDFRKNQEFFRGKFKSVNKRIWKRACSEDLPPCVASFWSLR